MPPTGHAPSRSRDRRSGWHANRYTAGAADPVCAEARSAMKRILAVVVLLGAVIATLIGWQLRLQAASLHGPAAGSGTIEGTSIRVSSRVATRIAQKLVRRGDTVHAGQVLIRMDCAEPSAMLSEAEARLEAAQAQVSSASAQRMVAGRASDAAVSSARASRANISALTVQREAAERERRRALAMGDAAPAMTVDQANSQADALDRQVVGSTASTAAMALQARAARAQVDVAGAQIDVARRNVEALAATVARARINVSECDILAPRDALVEDVYYEAGEVPPPGATLLELVDVSELKATFYLPNAEIGMARPAARANVEADAFPGVMFAAHVVSISSEAEFTPRNIQTRSDRDRLVYPVEVRLDSVDGRLRPGMPVQVTLPGTMR